MVTWLPRESATTPSLRSISERFCPYWPNSTEARRLSSKVSTTWVVAFSPAPVGVGTSEPWSDPRVRNASGLQMFGQSRQPGHVDMAPRRLRELAKQAVGAGPNDRHAAHGADQRGGRHHLHG